MKGERDLAALVSELTDLIGEDIEILVNYSKTLETVGELEGGDVYIDVLTRANRLAVVVAQYSPPTGNFYKKSLVGEIMWRRNEPGVYRTLEIGVPSREFRALVYEESIIVRQSTSPIRNGQGKVIAVMIVERNVRAGEPMETLAKPGERHGEDTVHSVNEMNNIANYMKDALIRFDTEGRAVFANQRAVQLYKELDYQDEILGLPFDSLVFGSYTLAEIEEKKRIEHTEIKIGQFILNVTYASLWEEGVFGGVVTIIRDTTAESQKERELILKSAAIEEIHHRVKNNLQTIVSIISLQSRRSHSRSVQRFASEINSRIYSISITHEILAQKGVDTIELKDLLSRMISNSKGYIVPEELDFAIDVTGDSIVIGSDIATTIALVVNELIQNSITHAFIGRDTGRVSLHVEKGEVYSRITVADDGTGITKKEVSPSSLGHKLVHRLVQYKLKGKLVMDSSKQGMVVRFDFLNQPGGA